MSNPLPTREELSSDGGETLPPDPATLVNRPEIVFGTVSPVGVDLSLTTNALASALDNIARYETKTVRISELIEVFGRPGDDEGDPNCNRIRRLMNTGDRLRQQSDENAICAMLAVMNIRQIRLEETGNEQETRRAGATLVRSLKHPDEVKLLREVYGHRAVIVGVSDLPEVREDWLRKEFTPPGADRDAISSASGEAADLIRRDESDENRKFGQQVRDAFELCDVYLSTDKAAVTAGAERLVRLLFGNPAVTPNRDEMGVWHAYAAKFRSSASGRQVGAVITDRDGEILVTGCNDVPMPGGGQNWDGESVHDHRDQALGYDANDRHKFKLTEELLGALKSHGWLSGGFSKKDAGELAYLALTGGGDASKAPLKGRRVASLLEFGRIMHAEMAALMTAARRGTPVKDGVLYTTTYPCHECMRLILGSGVRRVVYIDPYPKSLVPELYELHLGAGASNNDPRVVMEPFLGVAPRLVSRVFGQVERRKRSKRGDGNFVEWIGKDAAYVGEPDRFVDPVVLREAAVADMLETTFIPRLDAAGDTRDASEPG